MFEYEIIVAKELTMLQKKRIWDILVQADDEFVPPLSERETTMQKNFNTTKSKDVKGPKEYFDALMNQSFLLAEKEEEVVAFMSYIPNHRLVIGKRKENVVNYVSTIIVDKAHRSQGLTQLLYQKLFETESGHIATRTWSTNTAHLYILDKLGFKNVYTIKNDRGNGIDTVYYVK